MTPSTLSTTEYKEVLEMLIRLSDRINNIEIAQDEVMGKALDIQDQMYMLEDKFDNLMNFFEKREIWGVDNK